MWYRSIRQIFSSVSWIQTWTPGRRDLALTEQPRLTAEKIPVFDGLARPNLAGELVRYGSLDRMPRHPQRELCQRPAQINHLVQAATEDSSEPKACDIQKPPENKRRTIKKPG